MVGGGFFRNVGRIAEALEELVRLQRAGLTKKYTPGVQSTLGDFLEEEDASEVLYHDDKQVAEEEAAEEKKLLLKLHGR